MKNSTSFSKITYINENAKNNVKVEKGIPYISMRMLQ